MSKRVLDMSQFATLPNEIIDVIYQFIPKHLLVFTSWNYYDNYHYLLKPFIKNYESYLRYIIRRDHDFIFSKVIDENCNNWIKIKYYLYNNNIFSDYTFFLLHYSIENQSDKCKLLLKELIAKLYKNKNQPKKNNTKYINGKIKY